MRSLATAPLAALAVTAAACGGGDPKPPAHRVACDQAILHPRSATGDGYRVMLGGAVSVPPARVQRGVATPGERWPYWTKAALVVRAGRGPLHVSVAQRGGAGIGWGNPARPGAAVEFPACPGHRWNAYAGGFFLHARTACVPVRLEAGGHSATVRFGIGRRCPAQP